MASVSIEKPGINRRSFLKGATVLGLGSLASQFISSTSRSESVPCASLQAPNQQNKIHTIEEINRAKRNLSDTAVKGVDLSSITADLWKRIKIERTYFIGCHFNSRETESALVERGAILFPRFEGL